MRSTLFNRDSTLQFIVQISNGASTQVSEHEPRHIDAPQYQLNCPRYMHELYNHVWARGKLLALASLGLGAHISKAQERRAIWRRTPTSSMRKSAPKSIAQECTFRLCTSTPIRMQQDTRANQDARVQDARAAPLRASLTCARLTGACLFP